MQKTKLNFLTRPRKPLKRTPFKKKSKTWKDGTLKKWAIKKSAKTWKRKAWEKFSQWIRQKAKGVCFTCGVVNRWQDCDAGHFRHDRLDFDTRNVHCQCQKCNRYLHGNLANYTLALIEEIGLEGVNQLNHDADMELATRLDKRSPEDYKIMFETFSEELKTYET